MTKADLTRRYDWSINGAYNTMDAAGEGMIGFEQIQRFCRLNGYCPSDQEVNAIIRRMDVDAD